MFQYTIRQLSERYNIPASTLRYYEELGLLENVIHNKKNQRIYTDEHIQRMDAICCFKQTGMPLQKIREFFSYEKNLSENIEDIVNLVSTHEETIKKNIEELQKGLTHIHHKVNFYKGIREAIKKGTCWPCWEEYSE